MNAAESEFATALREVIRGEIRFGRGDRAMYASDASNYRHIPRGVLIPRCVEDMANAIDICAQYQVPVVHRGGGTGLAGQTLGSDMLVIDSSKYCRAVLDLDPEQRLATVEPGCVLDDLRDAAKPHGLTFAPDPSTHNHCTLGGMIGNNSCGVHSVMAGRTLDNLHSLEILTYDGVHMNIGPTPEPLRREKFHAPGREGEIYQKLWRLQEYYGEEIRARTPALPRLVSGYRLEQLLPENDFDLARALVGSESTCVTVLRATLQLVPDPAKTLLVAGFDNLFYAADAIPDILQLQPVSCEAMDHRLVGYMQKKSLHAEALDSLPPGQAWLLIEAPGDTPEQAREAARRMQRRIQQLPHLASCRVEDRRQQAQALWRIRESGLGATAWVPGMQRPTWPGWEDSAVPPERIGEYTRKLRALLDHYGYHAAMYGHLGDGLIHMRVDFGLENQAQVERYRAFIGDAAELVVRLGGSLSGEHGDGQARSELLPVMYGDKLMQAFAEFKAIWDPTNRMNPGNIVTPRVITDNLRFGPRYRPDRRITAFNYPEDEGDFRRAAIRCVGVGECRRKQGGTMCPSYRVTLEEKHSTRGRARLLQEMLQGDPLGDGWRSREVHQALSLCLACKACKTECPVAVDMATYRAEFFYHYYRGRLRPPVHYALDNIARLARLASLAPRLTNSAVNMNWAKRIIGLHPQRNIPPFARQTFRKGWQEPTNHSGQTTAGRVILWADTFNNHFTPEVLHASAELLAQTGYRVEIQEKSLCCGRPYYDFGMLDQAKKHLRALMQALAPQLDSDTYIVGIEPSCMAVFQDELVNLFPDDKRARRLHERTMMLGDFLRRHTDYRPPALDRKLIVHGHCHHKSVLGMEADRQLFRDTGATLDILDSGCCGMAGSFGYEKEKYRHSVALAEQVLLPALRRKKPDDLVVANGFSCRMQLLDTLNLQALTLPELLTGRF